MRIVVYRAGALGDTLLTFRTLVALRRQWPEAQITLICRADIHALALASGLADRAYSHELAAWVGLFAALAPPPDLVRDVFTDANIVLAWAPDTGGEIEARLRELGVPKIVVAPPPSQTASQGHVALRLLSALELLGVAVPRTIASLSALLPPLRWPQEAQDDAAAAWERIQGELAGRPAVAIHPGSGGARKRWPAGHFARLIHELRGEFAPILIAGRQDEAAVTQVIAEAGATPIARDLSVAALAAFLSRCAGYVGNDSGVTHLAGMLGLPTVALFGPTDPALWTPLGPRVLALRSSAARMEDLAVEKVVEAIRQEA
jgi:heptosyltransferase-3